MNSIQVSQDFINEFHHALPFEIPNYYKRIRVTADIDKFKWKEDESVWQQKRGLSALSYEVLFDGEFVCFFDLNDSMGEAVVRALEGIRSLFKEKKIFIHESMYEVIKAEREAKKKEEQAQALKDIPVATNEAEELVAKVLKKKISRRKNATKNS